VSVWGTNFHFDETFYTDVDVGLLVTKAVWLVDIDLKEQTVYILRAEDHNTRNLDLQMEHDCSLITSQGNSAWKLYPYFDNE
jgi:hypothetical protein